MNYENSNKSYILKGNKLTVFKAELQENMSSRLNHLPLCTFLLHSTQHKKLKDTEP